MPKQSKRFDVSSVKSQLYFRSYHFILRVSLEFPYTTQLFFIVSFFFKFLHGIYPCFPANSYDHYYLSCMSMFAVACAPSGGRTQQNPEHPAIVTNPPGSGESTGNTTGNSNSSRQRRGNRRLTRNESRYHSGEYDIYTCGIIIVIK